MRKYIICLAAMVLASFFAGFWSGDRQLVDEQGDSGTPHYHWVLSKIVTDDSQITEGLRTKGMNK